MYGNLMAVINIFIQSLMLIILTTGIVSGNFSFLGQIIAWNNSW